MSDPATRLNTALEGRYAIERELGEGGMATVYLADDLKHQRKVALKVLKPELAAVVGAERFLAEIQVTANLQHPHILPLHDSGEVDGVLFYVMPYVEGQTLSKKLENEKQLGLENALEITGKVASALDYAHEQGVVHRDIKPGNILLSERGEPTIADFGIALAVAQAGGERVTETGVSLGTPHYMSPEQAAGDRDIGPRSDVYALGCVLYEMLTGEPPYAGRSAQAVLAKILTEEPASPAKHRPSVPANVDASVRKALEKLPADRFESAEEFAKALEDRAFRYGEPAEAGRSVAGAGNWNRLSISMTALASGLAVALAVVAWAMSRPQEPRPIVRSLVSFPEGLEFASQPGQVGIGLALSPDGSSIVYKGRSQLLHRRLESFAVEPIPGTEGASNPVFSPDGDSVAFTTAGGGLRTVSLLGGPPRTVLASGVRGGGLDWGSDGMLYFSDEAATIQRVPVEGGDPELMTAHDAGIRHLWVDVLPEKRGFLFTIWRGGPAQSEIGVMDFDESEIRTLLPGGMARYAPSGHLVYAATDGTLLGAPFDLDQLEVTGPSVALGETVAVDFQSRSQFAVSTTGALLYVPGEGATTETLVPVWVDRDGTAREIDPEWSFRGTPANSSLALDPSGARLALSIMDSEGRFDLWIKQLGQGPRGPRRRFTFEGSVNRRATWSSDGQWLTFNSNRDGDLQLWRKRADGSDTAQVVLDGEGTILEALYSRDGVWVVFRTGGLGISAADIYAIRPEIDSVAVPLVPTEFNDYSATLSPDGRWLAYVSRKSGRDEVYVSPFPDAGSAGPVQVSNAGGREPMWAHSGRELFFRNGNHELVAVEVTGDPSFSAGQQEVLYSLADYLPGNGHAQFDVSPDDESFVMLRIVQDESPADQLILVQNFFEELKSRVPN